MPRMRNPARDQARALWEENHNRPLKDIAAELNVPENRIRKWKCEDKWEQSNNGAFRKDKKERSVSRKTERQLVASVEQNEQLTEEQRVFCLLYIKSFNATKAYQKAYGCSYDTANAHGYRLLSRPAVRGEIARLKELRDLSLMADTVDIVALHMRIAFADLTDYVQFGRISVPIIGAGGETEETEINNVILSESSEVDGRLISEVKQGPNGVTVKLVDRQRSLAFLERYFEINPMDRHKKAYDNARLELEKTRSGESGPEELSDDGFIDCMKAAATEVCADEDQGDIPI